MRIPQYSNLEMTRCITVVLSLLLVAVVHASQLKTSNVRQTNTILAGYYPGHKLGRSTWAWMNGVNMTFWDWAPGHPVFPATLYQCITLH
ncbi:hypothetical protein B566_EDAN009372, partial [Ephemera danica]